MIHTSPTTENKVRPTTVPIPPQGHHCSQLSFLYPWQSQELLSWSFSVVAVNDVWVRGDFFRWWGCCVESLIFL
jgi:hypothetical protein